MRDAGDDLLLVILDGVEDPQNVALYYGPLSVRRERVVIPEIMSGRSTDSAAKASAGALEIVKVAKVSNLSVVSSKS